MTAQSPDLFGRDLWCDPVTEDADAQMSEITGIPLVKQDLRHRLLTDSVLGPDGDDNGFDLRKLLGATAGTADSYKARIKRVTLKDERIRSATVDVTETTARGLTVTDIAVGGMTALGPFRLVFRLDPAATTQSQVQIIEDQ